jgi:hypothetical protein
LLDLLPNPRKTIHRCVDHRAPPLRVPTRSEDDAVVFSFNDLQAIVRTPRPRTLLLLVGDYEARIRFVEPFRFPAINPANFRRRVEEAFASGI